MHKKFILKILLNNSSVQLPNINSSHCPKTVSNYKKDRKNKHRASDNLKRERYQQMQLLHAKQNEAREKKKELCKPKQTNFTYKVKRNCKYFNSPRKVFRRYSERSKCLQLHHTTHVAISEIEANLEEISMNTDDSKLEMIR